MCSRCLRQTSSGRSAPPRPLPTARCTKATAKRRTEPHREQHWMKHASSFPPNGACPPSGRHYRDIFLILYPATNIEASQKKRGACVPTATLQVSPLRRSPSIPLLCHLSPAPVYPVGACPGTSVQNPVILGRTSAKVLALVPQGFTKALLAGFLGRRFGNPQGGGGCTAVESVKAEYSPSRPS